MEKQRMEEEKWRRNEGDMEEKGPAAQFLLLCVVGFYVFLSCCCLGLLVPCCFGRSLFQQRLSGQNVLVVDAVLRKFREGPRAANLEPQPPAGLGPGARTAGSPLQRTKNAKPKVAAVIRGRRGQASLEICF